MHVYKLPVIAVPPNKQSQRVDEREIWFSGSAYRNEYLVRGQCRIWLSDTCPFNASRAACLHGVIALSTLLSWWVSESLCPAHGGGRLAFRYKE